MCKLRAVQLPILAGCFRSVLRCQCGATAIEYALVASLISVAILLGALAIGQNLKAIFSNVASNL